MTSKFLVVATDGFDTEAIEALNKNPSIELKVYKGVPATELHAAVKDADFVIIRSATVMNRAVMEQLPKLKGVLRAGVGIDNIDLKAADELGVWVWNAPTGNYQATAELALGLLFTAARKISFADAGAKNAKWLKKEIGGSGRQLLGSTLGLFGAGNIGMRVAQMAKGIGLRVQICDPVFEGNVDFKKVDFETLLSTSDFVSIHSPLLDATRGIFNKDAFAKMKKSAILIHAARGGIVKDADLLAAIEAGTISGAGLDVFEKEPYPTDDAVYAKLIKDPRVVATPHLGASTAESQRLVGLESAEKIALAVSAAGGAVKAPKAFNKPAKARLALNF